VSDRARTVSSAAAALAGVVVFALLPLAVGSYRTYELTFVGIYFVALVGLNVLTGYSGQISLGHGAFMAIGAYTSAILVSHEGIRDLWTIPISGIVAGAVGYAFGYPALRLEGVYLALATFAIAIATPSLAKRFPGLTGGGPGINLDQSTTPFGIPLRAGDWLYYVTWGVAAVLFAAAWLLLSGRFGRTLRALRDSEVAAASSGIDVAAFKRVAFGVSALFAGVAGALFSMRVAYVNPDTFPVSLSILLLSGAVVGGLGTIAGPLAAAFFVQYVPTYAQDISKQAPTVVYGLVLIVVMFVAPTGLIGLVRRLRAFLDGRSSVGSGGIAERTSLREAS
jgi:branched-chain amino acid transport system permease protein